MGARSAPKGADAGHPATLALFGREQIRADWMRRIDDKMAKITSGDYAPRDFIMTFAKDADLIRGRSAPGLDDHGQMRSLGDYRADVARVIESDLADIVLTSLTTAEVLAEQGSYGRSKATPAVRLNDPTDLWRVRGGSYADQPARPYRSLRLDAIKPYANLGVYSMTFYNDVTQDRETLRAYSDFRDIATAVGARHFLEITDPACPVDTGDTDYAFFRNDVLVRSLAGVARRERPLFVAVGYHGPAAMEELAGWDPSRFVVGVSCCCNGTTTRDCLEMLVQAERHGARVGSFSREAFPCEEPVLLLRAMRRVIRDGTSSFDAVKAYHNDLRNAGLRPARDLQEDVEITVPVLKANEARAA